MSLVVVQTREDKHRRIGRKIFDGVPLRRTAMAAPMDPTSSLAEEGPAKNHPAQGIRYEREEAA